MDHVYRLHRQGLHQRIESATLLQEYRGRIEDVQGRLAGLRLVGRKCRLFLLHVQRGTRRQRDVGGAVVDIVVNAGAGVRGVLGYDVNVEVRAPGPASDSPSCRTLGLDPARVGAL